MFDTCVGFYDVKTLGPHKYGCLMAILPEDVAREIQEWVVQRIPEHHLGKGGRELSPHVTIVYGFRDGSPETVEGLKNLLAVGGPIPIRLLGPSLFKGNPDGDVLKIDVASPRLFELHYDIIENFDVHNKFPDYVPHITLAYLDPAVSESYAADPLPGFADRTILIDEVEWSPAGDETRERERIYLGSFAEAFSKDMPKDCHWVTLESGTRVCLTGGGKVEAGPSGMEGKPVAPKVEKPHKTEKGPKPPSGEEKAKTGALKKYWTVPEGVSLPDSFQESQLSWAASLSDAERKAIEMYTSTGRQGNEKITYYDYGEFLKQMKKCPEDLKCLKDEYKTMVEGVSAAIKKSKLPEPVMVYRGVAVDAKAMKKLMEKMEESEKTGKVFPFYGITSTSLDPKVAESYGSTIFRIKAKTGAYVEPVHREKAEKVGDKDPTVNYELIQGHDTRYRVTKISREASPHIVSMIQNAPPEAREELRRTFSKELSRAIIELEEV